MAADKPAATFFLICTHTVWAFTYVRELTPGRLDLDRYTELLLRAAHAVLQPLGVKEETLRWWSFSNAGYRAPPGELREKELPLFTALGISRVWRISV